MTENAVGEPTRQRALVAGSIGNIVEWYDFGIYGFVAPILAVQFFPSGDPAAALLGVLAIFAVAFVMRPLGGIVFGHIGDTIGRRNALALSVLLMSSATFAIGVTPSLVTIGLAAPIILLACRMMQGFSAGGEYMGAATFVLEHSAERDRPRAAGYLSSSLIAGFLLAATLITVLNVGLGVEAFQAWGWRIPFLLALPIGLVGLYLRLRLHDPEVFTRARRDRAGETSPVVDALRTQRRPMGLVIAVALPFVVLQYVLLAFAPSFLGSRAGLDPLSVYVSSAVTLAVLVVLFPLTGRVLERLGTVRMLLVGAVSNIVVVPAFVLLSAGNVVAATVGQLVLAVPILVTGAAFITLLVESFPPTVRCSSGSLSYNAAQAVFGGTAPFVATLLAGRFGTLAPAYYIVLLALVPTLVLATKLVRLRRVTPLIGREPIHEL